MKSGQFCKVEGEYYFKQFEDLFGYNYTLIPLDEIEGIEKSVEFQLCFAREVNDENTLGKKKLWFFQTVKLTIRPEISNIWLIFNAHKKIWYIRDFEELGQTTECGLITNQNVLCSKTEPVRTTLQNVREIMKTSGYVYNQVSMNSKNEIEDYIVTV
jgi:hypothetical protein